jgi:hypothetical protein
VLAQRFHVRNQVRRRVVDQARVRLAAAATALVEEHDPVFARVEEATGRLTRASSRSAVHEYSRLPLRVAAFFPVDLVFRRDAQPAAAVWLDRGIQGAARRNAHG